MLLALAGLTGVSGFAADTGTTLATSDSSTNTPAGRAEVAYISARQKHETQRTNTLATLEFARASFEWAEFATNSAQRAAIAEAAIDACREVLARNSNSAPAHYYLGINLGQLARTKLLGALKIVEQMEDEFKAAVALDPNFDHAGPHRTLGLLYEKSPGWPASIGNRRKAITHLRKAVELSPQFPPNALNLVEAYLLWDDTKSARAELKYLGETLAAARSKFTGEAWRDVWPEWEQRWEQIKLRLRPTKPNLKSPADSVR